MKIPREIACTKAPILHRLLRQNVLDVFACRQIGCLVVLKKHVTCKRCNDMLAIVSYFGCIFVARRYRRHNAKQTDILARDVVRDFDVV